MRTRSPSPCRPSGADDLRRGSAGNSICTVQSNSCIILPVTHSRGVFYNIMAKKVVANVKFRVPAGRASAGPPVGSILGQHGLNLMDFVNAFNAQTKDMMGKDVLVHVQIFEDRTYTFKVIGQPVDDMIREAIGLKK